MSKHEELIQRLDDLSNLDESIDCDLMKEAAQVIEAQAREIEGLRKDAERYRWLRHCDLDDMAVKYWPDGEVPTGVEFDAAVDAARKQGGAA